MVIEVVNPNIMVDLDFAMVADEGKDKLQTHFKLYLVILKSPPKNQFTPGLLRWHYDAQVDVRTIAIYIKINLM